MHYSLTETQINVWYSSKELSVFNGLHFMENTIKDMIKISSIAHQKWGQYLIRFPPLNDSNMNDAFSYTFIPLKLPLKKVDSKSFSEYLILCEEDENIDVVSFPNRNGNSTLTCPCPESGKPQITNRYLSDFMHRSSLRKIISLWRVVGIHALKVMKKNKTKQFVINTQGRVVRWLHVRIDQI